MGAIPLGDNLIRKEILSMLFEKIAILNENYEIEYDMYVGITDDKITYLSKQEPTATEREVFGQSYTFSDKIMIPGFYNAHAHVPMSILRGYGENLNLSDWLHKKIFPFEAKLTANDVYWATLLGSAEALKFGIVCNNDMYKELGAMCKAYDEVKIKANVNDAAVCFDDRGFKDLSCYPKSLELMKEYNNKNNGRIQVEFGLHAEYTSTEKIARTLAEACKEHNSPVHVHVAETAFEVEECKKRHKGLTPVEYLASVGIFDVRSTAAHCVHINENDARILKEKNVTIATCPLSNLKLASGIMPAKLALDSGINIAVGTDGVASNNNLNYLEDVKYYALLHKGTTFDPTLITPAQALHASTRAGALATGRNNCGFIKEGMQADLILLDYGSSHMQPSHNLLSHLVYASLGSDVYMTIVDGNILYENGEYSTIDIEKVKFKVKEAYEKIISTL